MKIPLLRSRDGPAASAVVEVLRRRHGAGGGCLNGFVFGGSRMSGSSVRRFSDGSSVSSGKAAGAEGVVPVALVRQWVNQLLDIAGHGEAKIPDSVNGVGSLADQMQTITRILGAPDPDSQADAALGPAAMQMAVKNRRAKTRQLAVALKEKARMAANPKGTAAIRDAALKTVGLR